MARVFVDLVKAADSVACDLGLGEHKASTCVVVDMSGSTSHLFSNGTMQDALERAVAIGLKFAVDAHVGIFPFRHEAFHYGNVGAADIEGLTYRLTQRYGVDGGTSYSTAIWKVATHYFPGLEQVRFDSADSGALPTEERGYFSSLRRMFGFAGRPARNLDAHQIIKASTPVFAFFITDGDCDYDDRELTIRLLKHVSYAPIFFQFYGIGKRSGFSFLEQLDTMEGRLIDNANFQALDMPRSVDDRAFFEKYVLPEYPEWLIKARKAGLLVR